MKSILSILSIVSFFLAAAFRSRLSLHVEIAARCSASA